MGRLPTVRGAVTRDGNSTTVGEGIDCKARLDHARTGGGPAVRKMTFHERSWMLKSLAQAVMARKEELYELSYNSGATRTDGWIDIEGGAGTLFSFSDRKSTRLNSSH